MSEIFYGINGMTFDGEPLNDEPLNWDADAAPKPNEPFSIEVTCDAKDFKPLIKTFKRQLYKLPRKMKKASKYVRFEIAELRDDSVTINTYRKKDYPSTKWVRKVVRYGVNRILQQLNVK